MASEIDIEKIKAVLRAATDEKGRWSMRGLSSKAGLTRDSVSDIVNGRNRNPTIAVLTALAAAMERDIGIFGLVNEAGEVETPRALVGRDRVKALRAIPIIGQVAAGNWREAVRNPVGHIPPYSDDIPPNSFALEVDGDSMDLLAPEGTMIVVDPDDRDPWKDRYYVITNDDGEATFKQYKDNPGRLVPCSSNPEHREIVMNGDIQYKIEGRVIWRASRM